MYEKQKKHELMSIPSHLPYFSYNTCYKIQDKMFFRLMIFRHKYFIKLNIKNS